MFTLMLLQNVERHLMCQILTSLSKFLLFPPEIIQLCESLVMQGAPNSPWTRNYFAIYDMMGEGEGRGGWDLCRVCPGNLNCSLLMKLVIIVQKHKLGVTRWSQGVRGNISRKMKFDWKMGGTLTSVWLFPGNRNLQRDDASVTDGTITFNKSSTWRKAFKMPQLIRKAWGNWEELCVAFPKQT